MLEQTEKKLLNILQMDFPLVERPFQAIAEQLETPESEVVQKTLDLKDRGIIRNISAFCDARKLGYKTTLIALHVPQRHLEKAAAVVSEHPGVSHNYGRNHYYNLWFTLALPYSFNLAKEVQVLAKNGKADDFLILPAIKVFKLNTSFDLLGKGMPELQLSSEIQQNNYQLTSLDRSIVDRIQEDLQIVERPFDIWADSLGIKVATLLDHVKLLQQKKIVRRFGASLSHTSVGLNSNVMVCWQVPDDRIDEIGKRMSSYSWVSHCYERLACTDWPFNLYTMVHHNTDEACRQVVARMSLETGINHFQMLFTVKEYKKTKATYAVR
jgi:DNA-binding Lrp family transcriptional regulator